MSPYLFEKLVDADVEPTLKSEHEEKSSLLWCLRDVVGMVYLGQEVSGIEHVAGIKLVTP